MTLGASYSYCTIYYSTINICVSLFPTHPHTLQVNVMPPLPSVNHVHMCAVTAVCLSGNYV